MGDIIREIQALAWVQILPIGHKSSTPYQFNCMHILPNANIPFSVLPLEKMISNKITFNKKYEKQIRDATKTNSKIHFPVQAQDKEAAEIGLILVDEYAFPHAIYKFQQESEISPEGLKIAYSKISGFLKLGDLQATHGCGVTLIVTPVWMFVAVINKPYHVDPSSDLPLYHDGFAYAGIFNLQDIK